MNAAARAVTGFSGRFGETPRWVASAPGRVNLIGEHTDYSDGFVMPMAIESRTVVAAGPQAGPAITLYSGAFDETVELDLTRPLAPVAKRWSNYAAGVVAGLQTLGLNIPGLNLVVESDVPLGAGLSSSAALEVAVASVIEGAVEASLDRREKARLCQRAEHEFAGVPSGIMDQLAAVFAKPGCGMRIDCRSLEIDYVDLSDPHMTVMIVNTNVRHDLADGAYANRRAACLEAARVIGVPALRDATHDDVEAYAAALGPEIVRRASHVVSENARVLRAADAFGRRDWDEVGDLMYQSHSSLRDDYGVTCRELDVLVETSQAIGRAGGVFGCRMTGGGFGGSVVCLVQTGAVERVAGAMRQGYAARTGLAATVMTSRPGDGAACTVLY